MSFTPGQQPSGVEAFHQGGRVLAQHRGHFLSPQHYWPDVNEVCDTPLQGWAHLCLLDGWVPGLSFSRQWSGHTRFLQPC